MSHSMAWFDGFLILSLAFKAEGVPLLDLLVKSNCPGLRRIASSYQGQQIAAGLKIPHAVCT
jgi:hypothetical protein